MTGKKIYHNPINNEPCDMFAFTVATVVKRHMELMGIPPNKHTLASAYQLVENYKDKARALSQKYSMTAVMRAVINNPQLNDFNGEKMDKACDDENNKLGVTLLGE